MTLGDSRGLMQPDSEWGFGLYYRDTIRAEDVRALGFEGTVVEPGDGGARKRRRPADGRGSAGRSPLPRPEFPDALRQVAPGRRRASAAFSLAIAETAATHHVVSCAGLLAKAGIEVAQVALAKCGEWALTEKGIVQGAGLGGRVEGILAAPGDRPFELGRAVTAMRGALGIPRGGQAPTA